jgi:hypothetical protein
MYGYRRGVALVALALLAGCGTSPQPGAESGIPRALLREARPIGAGPRFRPPAEGPIEGPCRAALGPRYPVHVELFAADRVVIIPAGIGVARQRSIFAGRITHARCYGGLVTLEPTGVVLLRPGSRPTLAALFRAWGQPLSRTRLASFRAGAGRRVGLFIDGRRSRLSPRLVKLTPRAEIVLEVGPHVPPHRTYAFPPSR